VSELYRLIHTEKATHPPSVVRPDQDTGAGTDPGQVKGRLAHLQALDAIGPTEQWLEGVPVGAEYRVTGLDLGFRCGGWLGSGRITGWLCGCCT
jgi:hypothetical protein